MKRPRPKYQVFVSSTYRDLHDERERVIWGILNARHIPAGMENFTATTDRGWETIRRVIDLSDYYVVILAGMYGSIDETTGISWTQREYEYAVEKGIPVLGFIREDGSITQDKVERGETERKKLSEFKATLQKKHLVQKWTDGDDLARKVVEALRNHINDDEDGDHPRPGWYRGDSFGFSANVADELARLSVENDGLQRRLEEINALRNVFFELIDANGERVTELRLKRPRRTLAKYDSAGVAGFQAPKEQIAQFLEKLNRSLEVSFRVLNKGNRAAKDIVVDFEFVRCARIEPDAPERPRGAYVIFPGSQAGENWKVDPKEHAYIDKFRVENKRNGFLRQRVKAIAPGVNEELVPFWVSALDASDGGWTMECNYSITDSDGAQLKGTMPIFVEFGGTEELTTSEIERRFS